MASAVFGPAVAVTAAGVVVSDFSLLVTDLTGGGGTTLAAGAWFLVPGPGA